MITTFAEQVVLDDPSVELNSENLTQNFIKELSLLIEKNSSLLSQHFSLSSSLNILLMVATFGGHGYLVGKALLSLAELQTLAELGNTLMMHWSILDESFPPKGFESQPGFKSQYKLSSAVALRSLLFIVCQ